MNARCLVLALFILFISIAIVSATSPPHITDMYPEDGATNVPFDDDDRVFLRVNIEDYDGDLEYVLFETNKSGSWAKITDVYPSGTNWTTDTYVTFAGLDYDTTYWWRINARDGEGEWTNTTDLSFTTEAEPSEPDDDSIDIVPTQPRAGKTVIFLANVDEASGYVICYETDNIYTFEIKHGLGSVCLGMEYGEAKVRIVGHGYRTFDIESPFEGDLTIDASSVADIGESVDISVFAQGEMVSTTLRIFSPTGKETTRTTSADTPLSIMFDEAGNWTILAEMYDTSTTKQIFINPQPLEIDLPPSGSMKVGKELEIEVSKGASVTIEKEDATWTYEADDYGVVYFTPPWAGRYKLTAESATQRGSQYFNIVADTMISIKDEKGYPINKISEGDVLLIQVTDSQGQQVDSSSLDIYADGIICSSLQLWGGSTIWQVDTQANEYVFDFFPENDALYLPASVSLIGEAGGVDALYLTIAVVIIVAVCVVFIANNQGWINLKDILPTKKESEMDDLL